MCACTPSIRTPVCQGCPLELKIKWGLIKSPKGKENTMLTKSIRQRFDDEVDCYQITKNANLSISQSLEDFLFDLRKEGKLDVLVEVEITKAGCVYSVIVPYGDGEYYAFAPTIDEALEKIMEEMANV